VPASPSASERELQVRTRREIAALGLQLGKMSIASWASKDDRILRSPENSAGARDGDDDAKKEEFEARAAAWAESQKCKLASRHGRNLLQISICTIAWFKICTCQYFLNVISCCFCHGGSDIRGRRRRYKNGRTARNPNLKPR
jgi:hypothetical protein